MTERTHHADPSRRTFLQVDFKTIFAGAETAGLKYFFALQDNAAAWGDSMAVARVSYQNLTRILAPAL